jgi:hypothetical protein
MTQQLSVEELLKPRYKVIAEMPVLAFRIGEIYNADFIPIKVNNQQIYTRLDIYPHLFKRLEWWEERTVEEMPKYIKFIADYMDFKKGSVYLFENWGDQLFERGEIPFRIKEGEYNLAAVPAHFNQLQPATEAEYLTFLNHQQ